MATVTSGGQIDGNRWRALRDAIDGLPPRRREALILVRFHGLSLDEVSRRMGVTPQTVSRHISRALDDLDRVSES